MQEAVIQVKDFRKTYGDFVAVDGISFAVGQGEIFGLLGPNGAGKTSTLECLEGLRAPNGGSLRVAGIDPAEQLRQAAQPDRRAAAIRRAAGKHHTRRGHEVLLRLPRRGAALRPAGAAGAGRKAQRPVLRTLHRAAAPPVAWLWRWPTTRRCSSWTNRPPGWMWPPASSCTT